MPQARVVAGGVPVGFHDQALGEQGRRAVADGCGRGGSGEVDRLIQPGQVERLVRLGGENLRRRRMVASVPRAGQDLGGVPLGQAVLVTVVGDQAGQLRQLAGHYNLTSSCCRGVSRYGA
ncbi:MAG TPA: hypothetical protein VGD83_10435 [Streptosporangiaceae bacterium]